jgi:hypothetical protein
LYFAEARQGAAWKRLSSNTDQCGYGFGNISLPARAQVAFVVVLPEKGWEEVRVRVPFDLDVTNPMATSAAITRTQVETAMKPAR